MRILRANNRSALGGVMRVRSVLVCTWTAGAMLLVPLQPAGAGAPSSVVTTWNGVLVTAIVETAAPPPASARLAAIVQGSVFDAVNGVARRYRPLHVGPSGPAGASQEAAAVEAAATTLRALFPSRAGAVAAQREHSMAQLVASGQSRSAIDAGLAWGRHVAEQHLGWRSSDTLGGTCTDGTEPGAWRRTSDNAAQPCAFPSLGSTAPFAVADLDRYAPPGPPALTDDDYARDLAEVVGWATRRDDVTQEATARFWRANSVVSWNVVAQQLLPYRTTRLVDEAHAYAVVNVAMADATRAAWRAKYADYFWRPITANEQAAVDGNPDTAPVAGFSTVFPTPNHPDYPSGHATISGAATRAMTALVGDAPFTLEQAGEKRAYPSLSAASDEVNDSRVFAGIHFRSAVTDGQELGREVADAVAERLERH